MFARPSGEHSEIANSHEVQVTENLEDALREIRRHGDARLWVDAPCINQRDIEERSRQALRMVNIYANAVGTVAWLGKAADNNDLAWDLMHILCNCDADKDTWERAMQRRKFTRYGHSCMLVSQLS